MKRVSLLLLLVMSGILAMANNKVTLTYDFEDGTTQGWTTIQQWTMAPSSHGVVDPNARTMEGGHASVVVTPTVSHSSAIAELTPNRGNATVILTTDDVWSDGTGYQMLLDADATAYGTIIPTSGGLTTSGDASAETYAEFEYKIPTNADGSLSTTNIVLNSSVSIQIPAGTYDWCITNPTPGDRMWIASSQGNVGGRADNYVFEEGVIYEFHVYLSGSNDATDVTITDPSLNVFTVTASPNPEEGGYVTIGYRDRDALTYDFENSTTQDWTSIDADGDGYGWVLGSAIGGVYLVEGASLSGSGNNASVDLMCSGSYSNVVGALTPDNYLVSPQVQLGGSISFWACGQDNGYVAEHFGVAVSTTNNTSASAFTTLQEWTLTSKGVGAPTNYTRSGNRDQGVWQQFTVDLSAYSGTGYVAIRHFDCTDMFILNVDDIVITTGNGGSTSEGTITFEDGQLPAGWVNDATYPWVVTSPTDYPGYNGNYCMMSGNSGVHSSTSTMETTVNFTQNGSISFLAGCWGEGSDTNDWDKCRFYIDGTLKFDYGAHQTWEFMTYDVSAGEHTFTWTYKKDSSVNPTGDAFFVDDITFVGAGGSSGGGSTVSAQFEEGQTCVLTAIPYSGYYFSNWTENGSVVSTNNPYSFSVTSNRTLVANFTTQQPQSSYTITATANPTAGGTVSMDNVVIFSDSFESGLGNWTTIDADGDGYNWVLGSAIGGIYLVDGASLAGTGHNASADMMCSGSYTNYTSTALNPDNYLVSPQVQLGGSFSFWACGQDAGYAAEHFGVAVSTTNNTSASAFTTIQEWTLTAKSEGAPAIYTRSSRAQGTWYQFTADLSAYAGQTGYVAIRHFNCTDEFILNVDDVELTGALSGTTVTGVFEEGQTCTVTATPNPGYYFINWTENGNTVSGNTTYSFTVNGNRNLMANFQQQQVQTWTVTATPDPEEGGYVTIGYRDRDQLTYDFENSTTQGWTSIDADGDGYDWVLGSAIGGIYLVDGASLSGSGNNASVDLMCSGSYSNVVGALTPDNYLVSPQVQLGGSISFWACGQDNGYVAEHFGVAVSTTNNTSASAFTTLQEWTLTSKGVGAPTNYTRSGNRDQGVWQQFTVDLSAYSGTGYVAIRHFDCTDQFILNVDDIVIVEGNGGGQTGGTVSAVFNDGQTCVLSAFPYTGYHFVNWTENGTDFTTDTNPYSFEVHANRNFVAHFAPESQNYNVNVSANPAEGGTVTGGGVFEAGQNCTVVAIANDCYAFVSWTENGTVVSTDANYTFAVNDNHNLVANFEFQTYTVTVTPNPAEGGTVAINGRNRDELTYDFENSTTQGWTSIDADGDGYDWVLGSAIGGIYLVDGASLSGSGNNSSVDLMCSGSYSNVVGALTPDNYLVSPQVQLGGSITFYACAQDEGYAAEHFAVAVSTTNNTSASAFTNVQEWTMTAKGTGAPTRFTRDGGLRQGVWYQFTADLSAYSGMGYVAIRHFDCTDQFILNVDDIVIVEGNGGGQGGDDDGNFDCGETCTVTATANTGYSFVNWTENGTVVSSNNVYSFTVDANRDLVANFVLEDTPTYTITVTANPAEGGEVEGGGTVAEGQSCTVVAEANECYAFVNWTENGTVVSTDASYTINNVTANHTLVANFEFQTYTITATPEPAEGGTVAISRGTREDIVCGFDNGMENWTTIDADGDGYDWVLGSAIGGIYLVDGGSLAGEGHEESADLICSGSYSNVVGALTPDNYLVSPQVQLGGSITFWACAQDESWPEEHFGVAVSTTDNTNAAAFTTIQEWTMTAKGTGAPTTHTRNGGLRAGAWYEFTVDLSAYAGETGYVAIRHFNCTDMFILNVDDITIVEGQSGGGETGETVTADFDCGETCTLTATANPNYEFVGWTEDGVVVSTDAVYTFTVSSDRNLVAHFEYDDAVAENSLEIALYPNPVSDVLNVVASENIDNLEVYTITGAKVYSKRNCSNRVEISTADFATGAYLIRLTTQSNTEVRRFVKF